MHIVVHLGQVHRPLEVVEGLPGLPDAGVAARQAVMEVGEPREVRHRTSHRDGLPVERQRLPDLLALEQVRPDVLQHPGLDARISTGQRPIPKQGITADVDSGGVLEQVERSRLPVACLGRHQVLSDPRQLPPRQPHDRQALDRPRFQDGATQIEPRHGLGPGRHVQVVQRGCRETLQVIPATFRFEVAHDQLSRVLGPGLQRVHGNA